MRVNNKLKCNLYEKKGSFTFVIAPLRTSNPHLKQLKI